MGRLKITQAIISGRLGKAVWWDENDRIYSCGIGEGTENESQARVYFNQIINFTGDWHWVVKANLTVASIREQLFLEHKVIQACDWILDGMNTELSIENRKEAVFLAERELISDAEVRLRACNYLAAFPLKGMAHPGTGFQIANAVNAKSAKTIYHNLQRFYGKQLLYLESWNEYQHKPGLSEVPKEEIFLQLALRGFFKDLIWTSPDRKVEENFAYWIKSNHYKLDKADSPKIAQFKLGYVNYLNEKIKSIPAEQWSEFTIHKKEERRPYRSREYPIHNPKLLNASEPDEEYN